MIQSFSVDRDLTSLCLPPLPVVLIIEETSFHCGLHDIGHVSFISFPSDTCLW